MHAVSCELSHDVVAVVINGRSVSTPGIRDKVDDIEGEVPIGKEAADRCQDNTMRAQYLSSDRSQMQVECWDLARKMQQASNLDEMGLKRLARILGVRPRLVWLFRWQKRVTRIESWCDTDHAGCILTRKSFSGCARMLSGSTICTYCEGEAVIALSSSEAEYFGLVSTTSHLLGLQSILLDWGWQFKAHVWMDFLTKHVDAATMLNCMMWSWRHEVQVGWEQTYSESVIERFGE